MAEIKLLDQIKRLIDLQKIDSQIHELKLELQEKPALLEDLKTQFEQKKQTLSRCQDDLKKIQLDQKSLEGELKAREDSIAKANTQLSQLKTNKEYSAKLIEIEGIKADKSIIEEKILVSYDRIDEVKAKVEKEKQNLAEHEKSYQAEKQKIEAAIAEIQERIQSLESNRNQIAPDIDRKYIQTYQKILAGKDGLAIVPVSGRSCGGCFMEVTAQQINEIKMKDKLVFCEMCNRILYLPEDIES